MERQPPDWMSKDQKETWMRAFLPMKPTVTKDSEARVHKQVAQYLKIQYPKVRFLSNLSGESFGKGQAMNVAALQSHNGAPDIMIFEQRLPFAGLALELKRESVSAYKQDGTLRDNHHLREQQEYLEYLRRQDWRAEFVSGFDKAKKIINEYLDRVKK